MPEATLQSSSPAGLHHQSCKTATLNVKEGPYPPNSRAANPVVVSIWSKSPCTGRYEACCLLCPSHGNGYLAIKAHQRFPRYVPYHHVIMLMGLEQIETCYNLKYDRQKNHENMSYVQ